MRDLIKRHPVTSYYMLTFAISWGAGLALVGPSRFRDMSPADPMFVPSVLVGIVGPTVAGIVLTVLISGWTGVRELISRLRRWRVGLRWYAVALLLAPVLTAATNLALSLASPAFLPAIFTAENGAMLLLFGAAFGLIAAPLEEIGWTGFAMPRLLQRHGILATGLLMGLLWGAWHFPVFSGSDSGDLPRVLVLAVLLFSWIVPYRVLMVWVYDHTESVLLAIVMHVPLVAGQYVLRPEKISPEETFVSLVVLTAALWTVVAAVTFADRGHRSHERAPRDLARLTA